ncbi:MAG: N-acetyl-D-Glu racemase DgcA [Hyphomicrobiales bacterium]|nr:N-acetyl-D-Glu racemase DgcA [Hyphomicrobiales bacterium]
MRLKIETEIWPLKRAFVISRGAKTAAHVVAVSLEAGGVVGRAECVPYARYGETVAGVAAAIKAMRGDLAAGMTRAALQSAMPAGAARNALDCVLWDVELKRARAQGRETEALAPVTTAFTISLGDPDDMAAQARASAHLPLLKVKLGGAGDEERIAAVREAAPHARLIVDANESWTAATVRPLSEACARAGVEAIEQPLPAGEDAALETGPRPALFCADESLHDRRDLSRIAARYDAVNVKLDKTGGLTEATALMAEAQAAGLRVMVGCMVGTSLAMAPALRLAQTADWVDLDGPLWLAEDRRPGLEIENGRIAPPPPDLWG